MKWIIIGIMVLIILLFGWAMAVSASRADDRMEKIMEDFKNGK